MMNFANYLLENSEKIDKKIFIKVASRKKK